MSDLAMDNFGDLDISRDDLYLVTGADAVAQHLKIRLRFFRGDWFYDTRVGLPYFGTILVKNPHLPTISNIYRRAIRTTPGVEEVERLDLELDAATRKLSISFSAKLEGEDVARDFTEEFVL